MNQFDNLSLIAALDTQKSERLAALPPFLRTLLVADGTVTRSLEAYFWEPIDVVQVNQQKVTLECEVKHLGLGAGDTTLYREVELRGRTSGRLFSTAQSYIHLDVVPAPWRTKLMDGRLGIGTLISDSGMESFREIVDFDFTRPQVVVRTYLILLNGTAAIQISEAFPVTEFE